MDEPTHGSVVLVHGTSGTAWQRFYSDGSWHSTHGEIATWDRLQKKSKQIILIHTPPAEGV